MEQDPEYHWSDKIRATRTSNENRQRKMFELTAQLKRLMGKKVLDVGGNAVLGFKLSLDFEEEEGGVVARAIGLACKIAVLTANYFNSKEPINLNASSLQKSFSPKSIQADDYFTPANFPNTNPVKSNLTSILGNPSGISMIPLGNDQEDLPDVSPSKRKYSKEKDKPKKDDKSDSSDDESLSKTPTIPVQIPRRGRSSSISQSQNQTQNSFSFGSSSYNENQYLPQLGSTPDVLQMQNLVPRVSRKSTQTLQSIEHVQLFTLDSFSEGQILRIGGLVIARSVKLFEKKTDHQEARDAWWLELRNEIRSHAKILGNFFFFFFSKIIFF